VIPLGNIPKSGMIRPNLGMSPVTT
jgi:hypothetical protein